MGPVRRRGKSGKNAATWVPAAAALLLAATPALAESSRVENRCPRLPGADYEELDARIQLLIRSEASERPLPAIVCDVSAVWLEWEGREFALAGRASVVDEAVDIIERQLHGERRAASSGLDVSVADGTAEAAPREEPLPARPGTGRPADRAALRASDARGGGLAVGIETELPSDTIDVTVGPTFDFGGTVGPLLVGGREAFRFSATGRRVVFMDFEGTVGYGAPLDPDKLFGATLRFGAEWMVAYPEGNSGQAAVAPILSGGLRAAKSFGVVSIWLGVDARWRLAPLVLRSKGELVANDLGGSLTLGAAFVDWSRK